MAIEWHEIIPFAQFHEDVPIPTVIDQLLPVLPEAILLEADRYTFALRHA